jgi:peptidoglycan/LPS O-acetylase OafA/YrhL
MNHRRDIDGLRAIAVVPVILYHAGISAFGGGFTGVDVFFVISGYLITSLLIRDLGSGQFSIAKFYERRARRIMPALMLVLFSSVVTAWFITRPTEMMNLFQSIIATITFSSNIYFWKTSGYFSEAAETIPLLHTWSLAVEEQYYIFFPLLLAALHQQSRKLLAPTIAFIVVGSLAVSEWGTSHMPSATFFLLPSRTWELCAGSLSALIADQFSEDRVSAKFSNFASLIGVAMVVTPFFTFSVTTQFPGIHAIPSVLGTTAIILFSRPSGWAHKILTQGAITHVGLISYSAYLWHQPIFAFARTLHPESMPAPVMLALCVGTFVIAHFCWKHIEQPARNPSILSNRALFVGTTCSLLALLSISLLGIRSRGFEDRLAQPARSLFSGEKKPLKNADCHATPQHHIPPDRACVDGAANNETAALVGDSHAFGISGVLGKQLGDIHIGVRNFTAAGCPPATGIFRLDDPNYNSSCIQHNIDVNDYIQRHQELKYIIVFATWHSWLQNSDSDAADDAHFPTRSQRVSAAFLRQIKKYAAMNRKVILVYPTPDFDSNIPQSLWADYLQGNEFRSVYYKPKYHNDSQDISSIFSQAAKIPGVATIRVSDLFCKSSPSGQETCQISDPNSLLYFDSHHLTEEGGWRVAKRIADHVQRIETGGIATREPAQSTPGLSAHPSEPAPVLR